VWRRARLPDEATAQLARRYLVGHGPADAHDLARWAGIPLGLARRGLAAIAEEVRPVSDAGLVDLADRRPSRTMPPPRLLGAYDPLLLGWVSREAFVGEHHQIVTAGGLFRPFALVDGRVVATWALTDGTVQIRLLSPLGRAAREALEREAADVLRFLGLPDRPPVLSDA
jgi:hypothetical protein